MRVHNEDLLVFVSKCGIVGAAPVDTMIKILKNGTEMAQDTSTGLIQLKVLGDGGGV